MGLFSSLYQWWGAADAKPARQRSPHWPAVRAAHLKRFPECAACGGAKALEVHHKQPFHAFPGLELIDSNLITLCEAPGRNCHYSLGHAYNWRGWNPHVEDDAAMFRQRVEQSRALAQTSKGAA